MGLYHLGSLFLDISLGVLLLSAIIRWIMASTYFKRNGRKKLTPEQTRSVKKTVVPVAAVGLVFAITSMVMLLICLR